MARGGWGKAGLVLKHTADGGWRQLGGLHGALWVRPGWSLYALDFPDSQHGWLVGAPLDERRQCVRAAEDE